LEGFGFHLIIAGQFVQEMSLLHLCCHFHVTGIGTLDPDFKYEVLLHL